VNFLALVVALTRQRLLLALTYRSSLALTAVYIFTELLIFRFLGSWIDRSFGDSAMPGGYFGFAALGVAALNLASGLAAAIPARLREGQLTGDVEVLFLAPVRDVNVVLALALSCLPQTLLRFHFELFLAYGMGANWGLKAGLWLMGISGLVLGAIAFSLVGSAFVCLFKRGEPIAWGLSALSLLMSGVWFPRESLPPLLQQLSTCLFTTHALELLRAATAQVPVEVGKAATHLGVVLTINWVGAVAALALALKLGKSRGDLVRY
jgi:ABC-2 type transporter